MKVIVKLMLIGLAVGAAEAQEPAGKAETVPELIRRPQGGEAPRYPQDTVIGSLGRGEASEEAFRFAQNFLQSLIAENRDGVEKKEKEEKEVFEHIQDGLFEDFLAAVQPIKPRRFRIGGGREESDGTTSFLVRFIGSEQWIAGELYLRLEEEQWTLDDLILEEPRNTATGGQEYRFDFSPYERFF